MWRFLRGLFMANLTTKLLALVLSGALFIFVQQSLTGTREISKIVIVFELDDALEASWILKTRSVTLEKLEITGPRTKVDAVAQSLAKGNRIIRVVSKQFRGRYGNRLKIPVDREFLRKENIFGEAVVSLLGKIPQPQLLELASARTVRLTPALSDDSAGAISKDNRFQGTADGGASLDVRYSVGTLDVRGPADDLPVDPPKEGGGKLLLEVQDLDAIVASQTSPGSKTGIPIDGIDWEKSGFGNREHVTINGVPAADFHKAITIGFDIVDRQVSVKLKLDIAIVKQAGGIQLLRDYPKLLGADGPRSFETVDKLKACTAFEVLMPKRLRVHADKLRLELDLTGVEKEGDEVEVPIRLGVKKAKDRWLLDSISIVTDKEPPVVTFSK